jgi:hypothetical protein
MAAKERPVELADMDGSRSAFAAGGLLLAVSQQSGSLQTVAVLSSRTSASAASELTLLPPSGHRETVSPIGAPGY